MTFHSLFKGRHSLPEIILLNVRWYGRYPWSYRTLEEMMAEPGVGYDNDSCKKGPYALEKNQSLPKNGFKARFYRGFCRQTSHRLQASLNFWSFLLNILLLNGFSDHMAFRCSFATFTPLVIGLLSDWFAYGWAIAAASTYGELIEAAFDLHRHLLYQSLRWYLNPDPEVEKRVGADLTQYLRRGF